MTSMSWPNVLFSVQLWRYIYNWRIYFIISKKQCDFAKKQQRGKKRSKQAHDCVVCWSRGKFTILKNNGYWNCFVCSPQNNQTKSREKKREFFEIYFTISNHFNQTHSQFVTVLTVNEKFCERQKSMRATIEIGENNQKRRKNADFGYCALVYWMVFKCFDAEKKVFLKLSHFFVSFTFFHWLNSIRMAICLIKCFFWVQFLFVFA